MSLTRAHAPRPDAEGLGNSNGSSAETVSSLLALARRVQDRRLRRVIEMIESGPSISTDALALEVNLSSSHLRHLFKQKTGVSITQLLTEQRLWKAARFLQATDLSVKEITFAVGYGHSASFIRAFHRYFAQTPRDYRLQNVQHTMLTK